MKDALTPLRSQSRPSLRPASADAAAVFASLYRRWSGDARRLSRESMQAVRSATGSRIIDVLSIWDEREACWLADAPTMIRLNTCDITAFAMHSPLIAIHRGHVETDSPIATFGSRSSPENSSHASQPFFWRSVRPCSYALGRTVERFAFETDGRKRLLALEAHLDDGGWLRMSSFGIDSERSYSYASRMFFK